MPQKEVRVDVLFASLKILILLVHAKYCPKIAWCCRKRNYKTVKKYLNNTFSLGIFSLKLDIKTFKNENKRQNILFLKYLLKKIKLNLKIYEIFWKLFKNLTNNCLMDNHKPNL